MRDGIIRQVAARKCQANTVPFTLATDAFVLTQAIVRHIEYAEDYSSNVHPILEGVLAECFRSSAEFNL